MSFENVMENRTCDDESLRRRRHPLRPFELAECVEHSGLAATLIRDDERASAVDDHSAVLLDPVEFVMFIDD